MSFIPELQRDLQHRLLAIWQGTSGLSPEQEEEYRAHWLRRAEGEIILGTQGRSLLSEDKLRSLIRCVRATLHLKEPMLEVGTYKGGSAWCISQADPSRTLHCCDTFAGHPLNEEGGHKRGDFTADYDDVRGFLPDSVSLWQGEFGGSDALMEGHRYSLIHLDCDYLTPEMVRWAWDRLVDEGILIVDDYEQDDCPTVKGAVDSLGVAIAHLEERQAILFKDKRFHVPNAIRKSGKKEILIEQRLSPGDMLGGVVPLIESIHRQFPGEYLTDVAGTCADSIFVGNPHVTKLKNPDQRFYAHYNVNGSSERSFSFAQAHCDHFSEVFKLPKRLINQTRRPSIYLTDAEREPMPGLPERFIVGTFGYKTDCDIKGKGSHLLWQEVVEWCKLQGVTVLQVGERNPTHVHQRIHGAVDMIGRTTTRQLIRLVSQATATFSSISFLTHVSAAFDVPNLCASSRESNDFAMYRTTVSLNCIGLLPCCSGDSTGGCWRNTLEPVMVNGKPRGDHCSLPVLQEDGTLVPRCTDVIRKSGAVIGQLRKIFIAKGIA